jgi:hypothetical protein
LVAASDSWLVHGRETASGGLAWLISQDLLRRSTRFQEVPDGRNLLVYFRGRGSQGYAFAGTPVSRSKACLRDSGTSTGPGNRLAIGQSHFSISMEL